MSTGNRWAAQLAAAAIGLYQFVKGLGMLNYGLCRFWPSCSEYAQTAFSRHGALTGFTLTLRRLARCRPGRPGGLDPVP